uniref:Uncharacterized protein n=1 Tax=Alexandrium monilatum TaxID=311494 RepID=A0A7S4SX99_9DINO
MCDIDWSKLYEATSREDKATPGYVFNEIVQNMSYADPRHFPAVAEYLTDCVDGDHAHVKLKALFVIKTVAYRVPPFCNCMRERITSVQEACSFQGPPSAIYGDEPYRLIREAAEAAMEALTGGEHYHEQYRALSQRIVGFGNFQPDEDTVLPDGSVNVGRDVTVKDVALSAVGFVQTRVGALLGGVKDVFYSPFNQKKAGVGALGADEGEEGDEAADGVGGYDDDNDEPRDEEPRGETDEDGFYRPSCGSYVPPALPNPAPAAEETPQGEREELESIRDLFEEDETGYWPEECALPGRAEPSAAAGPQDEASFMDMLGLGGGGPGPGTGAGPLALGEEALEPSEAEGASLPMRRRSSSCVCGVRLRGRRQRWGRPLPWPSRQPRDRSGRGIGDSAGRSHRCCRRCWRGWPSPGPGRDARSCGASANSGARCYMQRGDSREAAPLCRSAAGTVSGIPRPGPL